VGGGKLFPSVFLSAFCFYVQGRADGSPLYFMAAFTRQNSHRNGTFSLFVRLDIEPENRVKIVFGKTKKGEENANSNRRIGAVRIWKICAE
jgi:hypothetical protein